jgi:leader peptidase (prepilin peptidase)/N-methyltransferase
MDVSTLLVDSAAFFAIFVFVLSLAIGSFLNVVIHRLPIMLERDWREQCAELDGKSVAPPAEPLNLFAPRSRCPACARPIKVIHNIPVVSFVALGGKCATCGARISVRYPIIELGTAILSGAVAWHFGFGWAALGGLLLTWWLIAMSAIDINTQLLPDGMTLPLCWLGLIASVAIGRQGDAALPVDPASAILGATGGYLTLWSVYWLFKLLTHKEGMGYGDFKLLGALGAWMGWQMLLPIILLSAATGAMVGIALIVFRGRDRELPIPFGPYLAAAGWIGMIWGPEITHSYLKMAGLSHA